MNRKTFCCRYNIISQTRNRFNHHLSWQNYYIFRIRSRDALQKTTTTTTRGQMFRRYGDFSHLKMCWIKHALNLNKNITVTISTFWYIQIIIRHHKIIKCNTKLDCVVPEWDGSWCIVLGLIKWLKRRHTHLQTWGSSEEKYTNKHSTQVTNRKREINRSSAFLTDTHTLYTHVQLSFYHKLP